MNRHRERQLFRYRWHESDGTKWEDELWARDELEAKRMIERRISSRMNKARGYVFVNEHGEEEGPAQHVRF